MSMAPIAKMSSAAIFRVNTIAQEENFTIDDMMGTNAMINALKQLQSMSREEKYATIAIEDVAIENNCLTISWGAIMGFGEFCIGQNETGSIYFDSECMSKEFTKALFSKLIDTLYEPELEEEEEEDHDDSTSF